jgi:DNA-binding transcriptional ArsR family regulator
MTYEAALFALADPTRRAIFENLKDGPRTVGEIAGEFPVSRAAVSQHLRVLREAGLVSETPDGTKRIYRAEAEGLEALRSYLEGYWGDVLGAYAQEASKRGRRKSPRRKKR